MPLEFLLLGDVKVKVDGRTLDIGHARQVVVLVALLADANRPVPADVLLDRVWSGRSPQPRRAGR
jgi:DNA-binding winged helix-turn-helix (wHTH) protein